MSPRTLFTGGILVAAIVIGASTPAATATTGDNLVFSIDARLTTSVPRAEGNILNDISGNGARAIADPDDVRYNPGTKAVTIGSRLPTNGGYEVYANRFNFSKGITIEARVNFGKTAELWERIIDFGAGYELNNILFTRWGDSNELMFEVWQGSSRVGRLVTDTSPLTSRAGMHTYTATLTADGVPAIYVDGVEQTGEITWSLGDDTFDGLPLTVTRNSSFIGHSNWPDDDDARLSIQYIRIYDFAEDAAVVLEHATTNSKWDSVP